MKLLILLFIAVSTLAAHAQESKRAKEFRGTSTIGTNSPVHLEYLKLLASDDIAQKEVDEWIKDGDAFAAAGAATPETKATLALRVEQRLKLVREAYEDFIKKYPKHAEARLAYGSFLLDIHEETEAVVQMEKARELDPKNPAAWNNLANHYGHRGPVKKAFEYYAKAMELDTNEPVYIQNLATTTYLFRKDAQEFYGIDEPKVFDRALELYQRAVKLDPTNMVMMVDYAQTYYGIKPFRTNEALAAWHNALSLAKNSEEEQGIFLHLARVEMNTGRFEEARRHLAGVTNAEMQDLKQRLEKNWIQKRDKALGVTNSAAIYKAPSTAPGR